MERNKSGEAARATSSSRGDVDGGPSSEVSLRAPAHSGLSAEPVRNTSQPHQATIPQSNATAPDLHRGAAVWGVLRAMGLSRT